MAIRKLEEPEITRTKLVEWVQERVDAGAEPREASRALFTELIRDGHGLALLEVLGSAALHNLWVTRQAHLRPGVSRGRAMTPGARVVNLEALRGEKSYLEAMYDVGGRWIRLGDMTGEQCRVAAAQMKALAEAHTAKERWFDLIAAKIGTKTVRAVLDDAGLDALWQQAEAH